MYTKFVTKYFSQIYIYIPWYKIKHYFSVTRPCKRYDPLSPECLQENFKGKEEKSQKPPHKNDPK